MVTEARSDEAPAGATGPAPHRISGQLWRFAVIGGASTVLHLGLYWAFKQWWAGGNPDNHAADQAANFVALLIATVFNTASNRAWTFRIRGSEKAVSHQAQGLLIFAITWTATALALLAVDTWWPGASNMVRTGVILVANVISTAARFLAMRWWIFRATHHGDHAHS